MYVDTIVAADYQLRVNLRLFSTLTILIYDHSQLLRILLRCADFRKPELRAA